LVLLRARGQLDPLALDFIATCTRSALPSCIVPVIVTSVTVTTISGFVCTRRSAACEASLRAGFVTKAGALADSSELFACACGAATVGPTAAARAMAALAIAAEQIDISIRGVEM